MSSTQPLRLKPLKPQASRIFKLCLNADGPTALQGLELAAALGEPLEGVLDEVAIDPATGELVKGKRFTGNDKTQPMLDALLIQQLGLAVKGTPAYRVRQAVKKLSCIAPVVPGLEGFAALRELELKLTPNFEGPDLRALGPLPQLKKLTLGKFMVMYGQGAPKLLGLDGLQAPLLEEFIAPYMGLQDISALSKCKCLQRIDLKGNIEITSIDSLQPSAGKLLEVNLEYCRGLTSIEALRNATQLERLDIGGLTQITDLTALKKLSQLQSLDFSGCEGLQSLRGIPLSALSNPQDTPNSNPSQFIAFNSLKSLTSLQDMPPLAAHVVDFTLYKAAALRDLTGLEASAGTLKELTVSEAQITDLQVLSKLVHLEKLEINGCNQLVDASALGSLEKLQRVLLKNCSQLQTLPAAWKSSVKFLSLAGCPALLPIKALPPGIDTKTIEIGDRRLLPRAKPVKALKSDVGSIWKLLSSREIANVQMGLELSLAVEDGSLAALYEGVTVKDGQLVRGKRFTGTGPAQPFLDIALLGLLSRAPAKSPLASLREKITSLSLVLTSESPQLQGFTRLQTLELKVGDDATPDLSNFGPLPQLTQLTISGRRWNGSGSLASLQGLNAPQLQQADLRSIRLQDISALAHSPQITQLNLQENESLVDLQGLSACAPQLVELNLRECKQLTGLDVLASAKSLKSLDLYECESLTSLKPLAHCKRLVTLNLDQCKSLVSLEGLEQLPLECEKDYNDSLAFSLDGCASLTSLAHFPPLGDQINRLSLQNTRALTRLQGLRALPHVTQLDACGSGLVDLQDIGVLPGVCTIDLSDCTDLRDARPLGTLTCLQALNLTDSGVRDMPLSWAGPVTTLTLKKCANLQSLGQLPGALKTLECDGSQALVQLDGMSACTALELISVQSCSALTNLGTPPAALKKLVALGCKQLRSLQGLQACTALEWVSVPMTITDVSALAGLAQVTIEINVREIIPEKTKGDALITLPPALIQTLNGLASVRLQAQGPSGSWYAQTVFDLAAFNQFKNLNTLSFEDYDLSCEVAALAWLVPMQNLQGLWFSPRGNMSYKLGSSVHDSARKVRALQLKICQEVKIKPPAHLAD